MSFNERRIWSNRPLRERQRVARRVALRRAELALYGGACPLPSIAACRPEAPARSRINHLFADRLRKHAMHQTASTAWRATAGHIRTPTSLRPAPACARTAAAAQLYSSIAATNPRRARLGPSSRASQQAPPNESSAAPAIRPTINAAGASSDAPSSNPATSGGDSSKRQAGPGLG